MRLDKSARNNKRMRNLHKRLTVSLPADLVEQLDRAARRAGTSRSALVEEWLRRGARVQAHGELERQIEAYYAGRSLAERAEDESIAKAAGLIAPRLSIDQDGHRPALYRSHRPNRR